MRHASRGAGAPDFLALAAGAPNGRAGERGGDFQMGGTGTTGAGATIASARGAIIGASDWDREHLIPDPNPPVIGCADHKTDAARAGAGASA